MDAGQEVRLLTLTITPQDRERGPTRLLDEAIRAVTKAYAEAISHQHAVVRIDVTVRKP